MNKLTISWQNFTQVGL